MDNKWICNRIVLTLEEHNIHDGVIGNKRKIIDKELDIEDTDIVSIIRIICNNYCDIYDIEYTDNTSNWSCDNNSNVIYTDIVVNSNGKRWSVMDDDDYKKYENGKIDSYYLHIELSMLLITKPSTIDFEYEGIDVNY